MKEQAARDAVKDALLAEDKERADKIAALPPHERFLYDQTEMLFSEFRVQIDGMKAERESDRLEIAALKIDRDSSRQRIEALEVSLKREVHRAESAELELQNLKLGQFATGEILHAAGDAVEAVADRFTVEQAHLSAAQLDTDAKGDGI
jgi:hypothetical protein